LSEPIANVRFTSLMKIRVLLVDDSGFMRMVLSDIINSSPDIEVVDTAVDGKEATEKTKSLKPDVVLLDLTMKDYDGLYAVKHIMDEFPTPIVILSAMGNSNPDAYIEAMSAGALDFLNKPAGLANSKIREIDHQIFNKIRAAAQVDVKNLVRKQVIKNSNLHSFETHLPYDVIVIGASTGGTGAIEQILTKLPSNIPVPVVIAQHMPAEFVTSFAARLNELIPIEVKVASVNENLRRGVIYIAPGDINIILSKTAGGVKISLTDKEYQEFNHPSVDALLESAAEVYGNKALGIILTGMGKDGASGMEKMYKAGAYTIAQDEKTSVVFGMPKAACELGVVKKMLPIHEMATFIVSALS